MLAEDSPIRTSKGGPESGEPSCSGRPSPTAGAQDHIDYREQLTSHSSSAQQFQHERGKLTARARIDHLVDEDSFLELASLRSSNGQSVGVITGTATVVGRRVCLYAQDFTVDGGALGAAEADEIVKLIELAAATGVPIIGLCDSGGARIQEGALALDGYGRIFQAQVAASGVVPQVAMIMGPCAGGASYSPALADFTFIVEDIGFMYLTGPRVVEMATGATLGHEELGGSEVHGSASGLAAVVCPTEKDCFEEVQSLLSFLPDNYLTEAATPSSPTHRDHRPTLNTLVPSDFRRPYDVRAVIDQLMDGGDFFEVHALWARNVVCGFGRLGGAPVGVVANQPIELTGALDGPASEKAARFVRFCDAFAIPILTLVDVPGFLPGEDQERSGIIRRGAKLLYAYCEATVPRVQVILRKAFGGAYIVMDSRSVGCDISFAWPTNQIAVMGAEPAVEIIYRRELAEGDATREKLIAEYEEECMHPYFSAETGLVDDVVDPARTRQLLLAAFGSLVTKRPQFVQRRHGNGPM